MHLPIELQVALARQADLRAETRKLTFSFRRHETRRAIDGHRPVALRPSIA
jgi:hypothetical protein